VGERAGRSVAAWTIALACIAALLLGVDNPAHAADRAFGIRFQTNDEGDITSAANTVMTCPPANALCAPAQAGGTTDNNNFLMTYVDADSDATTFDSSTADLTIPAGGTVLFAGLYWGADTSAGTGGAGAPDPSAMGTVEFAVPGGAYTAVTASQLDTSSAAPTRYQGFADVTNQVAAAGSGTYAVANVQAGTGNDRYGGWALVVVYHDQTLPARNLTVFDGYQRVSSVNPTIDIPVSGFVTPLAGPVHTTLGFVAYEGDNGMVGDSAKLNGTTLSDAVNPPTNFFNSTISYHGALVTTKNPNYVNQLGFDDDFVDASGILANGATSATIETHTGGETYFPGVITFATDLYAPKITPNKTVTDLNGGSVERGDVLQYHVTGTNTGTDGAADVTVTDAIPAHTTYVPGSLRIVSSPGGIAGPKTDAAGDDQAEFAGGTVTFRVGTGADATNGGLLASGESFDVRFRVRVNRSTVGGTTIVNQATVDMHGQTIPSLHLRDDSPPVSVTVAPSADLAIVKTLAPKSPVAGRPVSFTLRVSNLGPDDATGVTVTDPLSAKITAPTWKTSQGACSLAVSTLTCNLGPLATGAHATIVVTGSVTAGTAGTFLKNTASVTGDQPDPDLSNNQSSVRALILATRLRLTKTADHPTVEAGDTIGFTLVLRVAGPVAAVNIVVCDTLPAHMTFSSAPGASFVGGKACWSFAHVAPGGKRTMRVIAKVDADAPTGNEQNVARAASANAGTARAEAVVHVLAHTGAGVPPVTG
jgi:uncharacterized repeat protein (TIGR01451 family)